MRVRFFKQLFPDTCTVTTISASPTMSEDGILTYPSVNRLYDGSVDIPCRIDTSRAFRPEKLPNQEINVNEYMMYFPVDFFIEPNDKILIVDGEGDTHSFELRKFSSLSEWRITNDAIVSELEGQHV